MKLNFTVQSEHELVKLIEDGTFWDFKDGYQEDQEVGYLEGLVRGMSIIGELLDIDVEEIDVIAKKGYQRGENQFNVWREWFETKDK